MKRIVLLLAFFIFSLNSFSQSNIKVVNSDYKGYYVPGSTNTYTITVINYGPADADMVNIANPMPTGVSKFSWTGPNGLSGINTPVADVAPMKVNEVRTYTLSFYIPFGFSGNLTSTTTVSRPTDHTIPDVVVADVDIKGVNADIVVTNTDNKSYYMPGTQSVYTINVTNNGPIDAVNVKISDLFSNGIVPVSWSATGAYTASGSNAPLTNTISTFKSGQTITYTVVIMVPALYIGDLTSQITVTSDTADPNPCTGCTDTDALLTGSDLVVTNTDNKTSYLPGTTNTYTVKVVNNGPDPAAGVQVSNAIPVGIPAANFSWTASNGKSGTNADLDDTIGDLPVGGPGVTYTITIQIPTTYKGDLTSATVVTSSTTDPYPACDQCVDTDTKTPTADIVVVNTDNQVTYIPGGTNVYTVTVTNNGPDDAKNVQVVNGKPDPSITQFSWAGSNGSGGSYSVNNTLPILPAGQSVTYTITLKVPVSYTGNLTSMTIVTSDTFDPDTSCSKCVDTDILAITGADIVVVNTDNKTNYVAGSTNVYKITVTNNGPNDASTVRVQNAIPAGITAFSWTGDDGSSGTNVPLDDTILSLVNGQTVTYTVTLQIPAGYNQDLVSTVIETSSTTDPNPACVGCTDTDTKIQGISAVNTDGQVSYIAGQSRTYTVTVKNNGPADAHNVVVTDLVPAGIPQGNVTWTGSNNNSGTGDLVNPVGTLTVGQTVTYQVVVNIPSGFNQNTNLVSQVTYTSDLPNPDPCTQCIDVDLPSPYADLQIVKTDNQDQFYYNSSNTYTIVVANAGPSDAVNVVVDDKVPAGNLPMTWSGSDGIRGSGDLHDVIPSLPVGATVTYVVTVQMGSAYNQPDPTNPFASIKNLINTVQVSSSTPDPVPACPGCSDVDTPRADFVTVTTNGVGNPGYTENLVKNILINSPCVNVSNFISSAACGFGYFNHNNSNFPIKEGLIIRCGNVKGSQGHYDGSSQSTSCSSALDSDLQAISDGIPGNGATIQDVSFVKFNFVASSDTFSFNYLFAANEYGTYQCGFADVFAFILRDETDPTHPTHNLAVIPGTSNIPFTPFYNQNKPISDGVPVSVKTIRQEIYNTACNDNNPTLFDRYNASPPANMATSAINMVGQTVPLTATGTVLPGHTYSIKLAIGDYQDDQYDSAVFIEAGSFHIGPPPILGPGGVTNNYPLCPGATVVIKSGDTDVSGITYSWARNGVTIPGETTHQLSINQDGVYTVTYEYQTGAGCKQSADYTVLYASSTPLQEANDLYVCQSATSTFDLTQNIPVVIGAPGGDPNLGDYNGFTYYHSQSDADNFIHAISKPKTYPDPTDASYAFFPPFTEGMTIYMKVDWQGNTSYCLPTKTFKLYHTPKPNATISYTGGATGLCRNSNSALTVSKSTPFTEGGLYSISPNTGLTMDSSTGTINLTNAIPGDYTVNYRILASGGCTELNAPALVKVSACISTVMNVINPVCAGTPVVLTCTDAGAGITYTWSVDGTVIGTTTQGVDPNPTSFDVPASITSSVGDHTCTVTASYGTDTPGTSTQTLVINRIPVAAITAPAYVCSGDSAVVTFSGTPGASVTFNDGTQDQTVILSGDGTVGTYSFPTPKLTSNVTYKLKTVAGNTAPTCEQQISSSAPNAMVTITVVDLPVATVSYDTENTICAGHATDILFNGTPGAEVVYTKTNSEDTVTETVTLNLSGEPKAVGTGVLTEDTMFSIVSVTSPSAPCVGYPVSSITVHVIQIPEPALKQKGYICVDPKTGATTRTYKLDTKLSTTDYTFAWSNNGAPLSAPVDQNYYDADAIGLYKVVVKDNIIGCTRVSTTNVLQSVPPISVTAEVTTAYFDNDATIVATAVPLPAPVDTEYEYALDYGPYQDSNTFEGVDYGVHVVHARDKQACDDVHDNVTVVNFPRYFTPNGDGINDTWNILSFIEFEDTSTNSNARIYIFDRFGKLMKQLSPTDAGWDGTYDSHPAPADDYWFVVKYQEQGRDKEFKAHFSLKR